jgi:hypothetical protein
MASTPVAKWTVLSSHIQPDRVTFGATGEFLRLYRDGKTRTHYGIHSYKYIDEFLASDDRYRSMGCVLVTDGVLDLLQAAFTLNGNKLEVETRYGVDEETEFWS